MLLRLEEAIAAGLFDEAAVLELRIGDHQTDTITCSVAQH